MSSRGTQSSLKSSLLLLWHLATNPKSYRNYRSTWGEPTRETLWKTFWRHWPITTGLAYWRVFARNSLRSWVLQEERSTWSSRAHRWVRGYLGEWTKNVDKIVFMKKLDTKTLQRLETAVSKSEYSQGKKLKVIPKVCVDDISAQGRRWLVPQVNPDIKGGLVVEIGDRTIDLSVSSKITKMNKLLTDTI